MKTVRSEEGKALKILYDTVAGRLVLKVLASRPVSKAAGLYMNSRLSAIHINKFIKKNKIDLSDYEERKYKSFNDFFTRKINPDKRSIPKDPNVLISPCDSKLQVYKITENGEFYIKNSVYTIEKLLGGNKVLAREYLGGYCLIFRLCVDDYHRYCYFDSGVKGKNHFIRGVLHTVQPIALKKYPIYHTNCREYTVMNTDNFGLATQVEVGAMLVGKIKNHMQEGFFRRGEEKGMFLFGGSTIVLLLKSEYAEIDERLFINTQNNLETVVKMGQVIGKKKSL